jgi:Family of unknown function (DUF5994)
VNGLSGSRRLARPVRLALSGRSGADIDGAWWPHTGSVAHELPGLIECLHKPLGEILDIAINWSVAEGPLDLDTIVNGTRSVESAKFRRPRLMVVDDRDGCLKLLVIPHMTSPALGSIVMRCAAAKPVREEDRGGKQAETAELVMQTAEVESAKWTAIMRDEKAAAKKSARKAKTAV